MERYIQLINELNSEYEKLVVANKVLSEGYKNSGKEIDCLKEKIVSANNELKNDSKFFESITPVKVYHHKDRRNTTVKFMDNSSVTVKLAKGEKHSLETAIVYALAKKVWPKKLIEKLLEEAEVIKEERMKECKKD